MAQLGDYLRARRESLQIGLRKFCEHIGMDPSNYSKIERGTVDPPQGDVLRRIAKGLKISQKSPEWREMQALAAGDRGLIPDDIRQNERVMEAMPAFYDLVRNSRLVEVDGETLFELYKKSV